MSQSAHAPAETAISGQERRRAFFVVGHEDWGKSATLRAMTDGSFRRRWITIRDIEFFIRRMSNDDKPKGFVAFVDRLNPAEKPYLILTLCPNFADSSRFTERILTALQTHGYDLFFWVIEHQHGSDAVVAPDEIAALRQFGFVEVFSQRANLDVRSRAFREFVSRMAGA